MSSCVRPRDDQGWTTAPAIDLNAIVLHSGNHDPPRKKIGTETEGCALEWVSVLAGESWSDHPKCTDPYIASFVRNWNDAIQDDARRTELLRPLLLNTRGSDALMLRRMWVGIDWDIRTRSVAFLRLAKLDDVADAVAALPEIRSQADLTHARVVLQEARAKAAAAKARLAPTVVEMQASAQDLVRRLCALKEETPRVRRVQGERVKHGG
jgi:hypothetical protein